MDELLVIREYDDGTVLVCNPWGKTAYLTEEEYKIYRKNQKNLEENENTNT